MKALTILKYLYNGSELGMPSLNKINEAIKELEDIQDSGCHNCKHYKQSSTQIYKTCFLIKVNGFNLESDIDFSCNKWESK